MIKSTRQILIEARNLIAQGWCQGALARDADNFEVLPTNYSARLWCVAGAVDAVAQNVFAAQNVFNTLLETLGVNSISVWNDAPERTKVEVLELFDRVTN